LVIRFDRGKTVLRILTSIGFIAFGVWIITHPSDWSLPFVLGSGCIAVGVGMVVAQAPRLLAGPAIVLDEGGFKIFTLSWRWRRVAWFEVEGFSLFSNGLGSAVRCRLIGRVCPPTAWRAIYDPGQFVMPLGVAMAPEDLEQLLSRWRDGQVNPNL
jgi:hypothetical protein